MVGLQWAAQSAQSHAPQVLQHWCQHIVVVADLIVVVTGSVEVVGSCIWSPGSEENTKGEKYETKVKVKIVKTIKKM